MVPFELTSDEAEKAAFAVNVHGVSSVARRFLPLLRGGDRFPPGRLVVVGSVAGLLGRPLMQPYSASKAAVRSLADSLRRELGPLGVSVSRVDPGYVATRMLDQGRASLQQHENKNQASQADPASNAEATEAAAGTWAAAPVPAFGDALGGARGGGGAVAARVAERVYGPMRRAATAKLRAMAAGAPLPEASSDACILHALASSRPQAVYHPGTVGGRRACFVAGLAGWLGALDPAWADRAIAALS
jgi:hypothetical protein